MTIDIDAIRRDIHTRQQFIDLNMPVPTFTASKVADAAPALLAELDRVRADLAAAHNHAHRQDTENQRLTRAKDEIAGERDRLMQQLADLDVTAADAESIAAARTERETGRVAAFNSAHPIGTPVRYWKGAREGVGGVSTTRTTAQMLGGHTAVVWLDGVSGCIALTHIEPIATTAEAEVA